MRFQTLISGVEGFLNINAGSWIYCFAALREELELILKLFILKIYWKGNKFFQKFLCLGT